MARMPSSWATSGTSSTSSLKKRALGYVLENLGSLSEPLRKTKMWSHSLDDLGRNDLAGSAPSSEAVKDHQARLVVDRLIERRLSGDLLAVAHENKGASLIAGET